MDYLGYGLDAVPPAAVAAVLPSLASGAYKLAKRVFHRVGPPLIGWHRWRRRHHDELLSLLHYSLSG